MRGAPEAFTLIGSGMILFAVGMVGVVLLVQLCFVAFPKMFRWIVKICKNHFIERRCHNEKRMEEILDHKWCDCRNRRAVLILGFILGVSFSKIKFGFPYIFPLSNRVVTVKESTGQTGEEKTFEGVKNLEMDVDHMSVYLKPSQNGKVCVGTEDIDERANLQIYKEGDTLNIETDLEVIESIRQGRLFCTCRRM